MKNYVIYDEELGREIGYLFYYEKAESFIIELCSDIDEWEAPLLFQGLVRKGIYTISKDVSLMWVKERVIPSGRQNIGEILKTHKLKEYSEMAMLHLSKGKSSQDRCYIQEISEEKVPKWIKDRRQRNVMECFPTEENGVICMFRDNTTRLVSLTDLMDKYKDISHVLKHKGLLESVEVGVGGYSISFNKSIEIAAIDLRETGVLLPLKASDFYGFVRKNIVDTTEACEMIECTRQNLSYLVREKKISPIIKGTKENLYTKGELIKLRNE